MAQNLMSILVSFFYPKKHATSLVVGFFIGAFIGFIPFNTGLDIAMVLITLCFTVPVFSVCLGAAIFYMFQLFLLPVMHDVGLLVLADSKSVSFLFKWIYHIPFFAYLDLNYSVICGAYLMFFVSLYPSIILSFWVLQYLNIGQKKDD